MPSVSIPPHVVREFTEQLFAAHARFFAERRNPRTVLALKSLT
jgi:hypothetical protein